MTLYQTYFKWLSNIVVGEKFARDISYRKLLKYLFETDFTYGRIRRDQSRAADGIDLRDRFGSECGISDRDLLQLDRPCSVLEMMIALSIRCEETIMDDPAVGDRTGQWFWGMLVNMGLGTMTDDRFRLSTVRIRVQRFLDREYKENGRGGLFSIPNCDVDLREVEIWHQLCWYLDSIT